MIIDIWKLYLSTVYRIFDITSRETMLVDNPIDVVRYLNMADHKGHQVYVVNTETQRTVARVLHQETRHLLNYWCVYTEKEI